MGRPAQHTDVEVVTAISMIRHELGACTVQELATRLGVAKATAHLRVQKLVEEGLVENTGTPGGIRPLVSIENGALQLNLLVQIDRDTGRVVGVESA